MQDTLFEFLKAADWKCGNELCPHPGIYRPLNRHHLWYPADGSDGPDNWQPLCRYCHVIEEINKEADRKRFRSRKMIVLRAELEKMKSEAWLDFGCGPLQPVV